MSLWSDPLQISRVGSIFRDPGLDLDRRHFESAAQDLLQEWTSDAGRDPFLSYRKLRQRQMSGTDRAAKVAEEDDGYKVWN